LKKFQLVGQLFSKQRCFRF